MQQSEIIGPMQHIVLARAADEKIRQGRTGSGGAVTTLLISGLSSGEFDAVVATVKDKGIAGKAVVMTDKEELLSAAGSRWTLVENLRLLHQALSNYQVDRAAVVCTPCQAHFLRQTAMFPLVEGFDYPERLAVIVGLFCMGTFSQPSFTAFLRHRFGVSPLQITEVSLCKGALHVNVECQKKPLVVPISEATEFVNLGCLLCDDYTARCADISAGTAAAAPGWTVLIVRTEIGERILEAGKTAGLVEVAPVFDDVLDEINQRAVEKLCRATKYRLEVF